ncbi:MAG: recombinase family protein [Candidatus Pacearchaeota archaeon]|nr:recombinase family protein [Candidatus Pacearchaeota archaeon]
MKCPKCGHEFEIEEKREEDRGYSQKEGMIKRSSEGKHMSRAPFGYEWDLKEKTIIPSQYSREVEEIFEEFLQPNINLSKLAEKHNLSVNGLKKILKNFVYVGKVKFDGQIHEGKHAPLVSTTLFNHVQDKLEKIKRKKKTLKDI